MPAIEAFNIDAVISTEQLRMEISTLSVSHNFLFILIGK